MQCGLHDAVEYKQNNFTTNDDDDNYPPKSTEVYSKAGTGKYGKVG